uniref:Uncharacterized protein n=1 Tax=Siphoviridae sp. ctvph17 TaxID=2825724 RepID=A0A8S5UJJ1_9CAUD|nr:MAG TPA: hypothetical protein [Siphoviridae sp. ctvph17]
MLDRGATMPEKMPARSKLVVDIRELQRAIRAVVGVTERKPEIYDVVRLITYAGSLLVVAANPQHVVQAYVSAYFDDVEEAHRVVEITTASAKLFLKLKPDKEEDDARAAIFIRDEEVQLQDLSGTCGDLTEVTAARADSAFTTDVAQLFDRVRAEAKGAGDAGPIMFTAAQAAALGAAARQLDTDIIPVPLATQRHRARVYFALKDVFESYSFVPADRGVQEPLPGLPGADVGSSNVGADAAGDVVRDGDGFEYDTVIDGAKPQKARVRLARSNPTGGAV